MATDRIICPNCHVDNPSNANFCRNCRYDLRAYQPQNPANPSTAPVIQPGANRWARYQEDYAVKIQADDLRGIFQRTLEVDPGTSAMIIANGENHGLLPPGSYRLDNLPQRLMNWLNGGGNQATALLVDTTPADFEFNLGGIFTSDPLQIGVTIRLQFMVDEPAIFLINMLKGQDRLTREAMRQYLYPQVAELVIGWVRGLTARQLAEDLSLHAQLETLLEASLTRTLQQNGMKFLQARAVAFTLEHLDKINGIKSQYALQISEAEARAAGRRTLLDATKELNLVALAEENEKILREEQRIELMQRMRQAILSDRMNAVRTQDEFERFLDEIDRGRLLRENQRADLLRTWAEEKEDHDKARAHLLARLEAERSYELRMIELKQKGEYDQVALAQEQDIARSRAEFQYEMEVKNAEHLFQLQQQKIRIDRERWQTQIEQAQAQARINAIDREQDLADFELAQKMLAGMDELQAKKKEADLKLQRLDQEDRLRIAREDELIRRRELQKLEIERWEAEERRLAAAREHELRRMQELSKLSAEALISASGPEQAAILADLRRTEALKGLSEEQILAAAAERSPEIARAFQEKFRSIAAGQSTQREQELFDRLLGEKEASLRTLREEHQQHLQDLNRAQERMEQLAERGFDRMAEMGKPNASASPNVVVVGGAQGPQVVSPNADPGAAPGSKICMQCGRSVPLDTRFCPHCGKKLVDTAS